MMRRNCHMENGLKGQGRFLNPAWAATSRTAVASIACTFGLLLGGCASAPPAQPVSVAQLPSPVITEHHESLSPAQVQALLHHSNTYRLGAGDVVSISVYLHPDLSVPPPSAGAGTGLPGALISNDGNVQIPLLGNVHVAGLTLAALQAKLTALYRADLRNPQVSVQLQSAHSIRYYLLGSFKSPGLAYSDRPLNLLEALSLGGADLQSADLRGAYVVQDGHKLPVNFHALVQQGDLQQNIALSSGDSVVIPNVSSMQAFAFGAVGKPGPVPFVDGRLSLLQALSEAGMDASKIAGAQLEHVRVIRSEGASGELITVDARAIERGDAAPFYLKSGDVIFVPENALQSWNDSVNLILPSLQAFSAVLNPFVQIKYLKQ